MANIYEDLGHLMGDLEFGESVLETMILNGKNEKANRYLREAALEIGSPPNRVHEIAQTPYGIRIFSHFASICYKSFATALFGVFRDGVPLI